MNSKVLLSLIITLGILQSSLAQYDGYSSKNWKKQVEIEKEFLNQINLNSFKKHLKKLTERPHVVGSKENENGLSDMSYTFGDIGKLNLFSEEDMRTKYLALKQAWEHYQSILEVCKTKEQEDDE